MPIFSSSGLSIHLKSKTADPYPGGAMKVKFSVRLLAALTGWLACVMMSGCIYNISLLPQTGPLEEKVVEGSGENKVLLLDITGMISEEKVDGLVEKPDMVSR